MNISEAGIALIREYEKLRLVAYKPTPNDVWTCGWGSTSGVTKDTVWTEEEAEAHFRKDIANVERCVARDIQGIEITQGQYDAIISLVFNIGCGAFHTSTLLVNLLDGDIEAAAKQFRRWNKQKDRKTGGMISLAGLTERRAREEELFRT
jgi:lysozyme